MVSATVSLDPPDPGRMTQLVEELRRLGVSTRRVAAALDIDPSTIYRQMAGTSEPTWMLLRALEREIQIARARAARRGRLPDDGDVAPSSVELPMLGTVNAGSPISVDAVATSTVHVDPELMPRGRGYVLRVGGESMAPELVSGVLVVVDRDAEPRERDVVVIDVRGQGTLLRRLMVRRGKRQLEADAKGYEPMPYEDEEIVCQGVVVGVLGRSRRQG